MVGIESIRGANMAFKIGVLLANARVRAGWPAAAALGASELVLLASLVWQIATLP